MSFTKGKIEPPRCKNAVIRLESERIYFTVEVVNGPVSVIRHSGVLVMRLSGSKLPNFESVSPAAMGEVSWILGWGPWGSSPRGRKRMRSAWSPTPGNDKKRG